MGDHAKQFRGWKDGARNLARDVLVNVIGNIASAGVLYLIAAAVGVVPQIPWLTVASVVAVVALAGLAALYVTEPDVRPALGDLDQLVSQLQELAEGLSVQDGATPSRPTESTPHSEPTL